MIGVFFVIRMPGLSLEHIPANGKCIYLMEKKKECDLLVSTDNYIQPYPLSLYTSVESPLTSLKDQTGFTYTATVRSNSTFPLSAWYMPSDDEFRSKNPNLKRNGKGVILISNCIQFRLDMVSDICKKGFKIDVYGSCYVPFCNNIKRNTRFNMNWNQEKRKIIEMYSYVLAIENAQEDNYVTEKVYDPLLSHTLPFYWGAPNVDEFIPHPASIITNIDYLRKVLENKELYKFHTEGWRYLSFNRYKRRTLTLKKVLERICDIHS